MHVFEGPKLCRRLFHSQPKEMKEDLGPEIVRYLREMDFPRELRRSVLRSDDDAKGGFVLGEVLNFSRGYSVSHMTRRHPALAGLVTAYARQHFPHFKFGTVQVNSGGSGLHVDQSNCGPSYIVALGDHEGGELYQYPTTVLDIREKPAACNGLLPHITLPFVGERFSLVFFTLKVRAKPAAGETLRYLRKLGFHPQSRRRSAACLGHDRRDLLPDAARRLRAAGISRKHIGDYENRTIAPRYRAQS